MKRLLPFTIFIAQLFIFSLESGAQCGYPTAFTTNSNYCVGSTFGLTSTHALEKIVWYSNGHAMDSAKAVQSLSTNGITVVGGSPSTPGATPSVYPSGIFVDEAGNLYVADNNQEWVKKYPPGSSNGVVVAGGHGVGRAADELDNPTAIFVDRLDNIFVYDAANNRIQEWAPGASAGVSVAGANEGSYSGLGAGLYVDCGGNIYVGDAQGFGVLEFPSDPNDPNFGVGKLVAGGHGLGSGANQFYTPGDICLDQEGNIFVDDTYNWRVQEWAAGAATGTTIAGGNGRGLNDNQITAVNIWVSGDDTVYVSDNGNGLGNSRVQKWGPGATSGQALLGGNGVGTAPNQFNGNGAIYMDNRGNIFVSDGANFRVQEFKRDSHLDSTFTPAAPGEYYAVVTDMRGFTETTDTLYVNSPPAGPPSISITSTTNAAPVCVPISFTATPANVGLTTNFQWEVSGVRVGDDTTAYSNNLFANGDQVICIMTTQAVCTQSIVNDTSNIITLAIDPQGAATVTIAATKTQICQGDSIDFTASVANGAAQPTFEWLLNGNRIPGDDSATWHSDSLSNGDILTCLITSDDVCGLAKSNSIPVTVSLPVVIVADQSFTIPEGKSLVLMPSVTGNNIISWLWTPGTGLSDSTIENPVADPSTTTLYTLKVVAVGGCSDTASILVNVYTPLGIPNAFTPNGDGHNDVFYVGSGPQNSRVEDFAVFNRWGQAIFHVHNVLPGDPSVGWNGYVHGQPAPPDTYVYLINMKFSDGSHRMYKGTVILVR
jgi:gliding motility-associated-like protein